MPEELRKTKLFWPPIRRDLVRRQRLIDKLDGNRRAGVRFTLVSAPPGFGKTTLISEWTRSSGLPTAWLALDDGDNDPIRFFRYLIAALQTAFPGLGTRLEAPLSSQLPPSLIGIVTELVNDLVAIEKELILVLEDYHWIRHVEVHAGIEALLQSLPSQLNLAITTRSDPPLRLARHRSQGSMADIRAEDLRFTAEETAAFVRLMKLGLDEEDIISLNLRTEGWIAGLQMAALSLKGEPDHHAFIQTFQGDDRHVADYLIEEVLQHQPAEIQSFLLQTSVLKQFTAPLCEAVTGRRDSVELLQRIEHANLFLFPLDAHREWYRYHLLFSDLLRRQLKQTLGQEEVESLQARALAWLEEHRPVAEAVDYAISCASFSRAADLITAKANLFFSGGDLNTLLQFAGHLPPTVIGGQLPLCCILAWAALVTGHPKKAEGYIQLIEDRTGMSVEAFVEALSRPEGPALTPMSRAALLEAAVAQARIAVDRFEVKRAVRLAEGLLPYLTPEWDSEQIAFNLPSAYHGPTLFILGLARKLHGDINAAVPILAHSIEEGRRSGNLHIVALASGHLGESQVLEGHLARARQTWSMALDAPPEVLRTSAFFGMSHIGLGNLACEWNDLAMADEYIQMGLEEGRLWNSWECLLPGYLGLARLRGASGDWRMALAALDELDARTEENRTIVSATAESYRALIHLRSGDLSSAVRWADRYVPQRPQEYQLAWERDALVRARVWLAQGGMEEAGELLRGILGDSRQVGRIAHWLEAMCLEALRLDGVGSREKAHKALRLVLKTARPEGYLRLFLDEGERMRWLLQGFLSSADGNEEMMAYVAYILRAFRSVASKRPPPGGLAENLTPREQEVLKFMAQGLSNSQIAGCLFISPNTLKAHSQSIFTKLDVHNRMQAVLKARDLGLVD
jgi:LuxR family maltose regulon positive regulatory protein